MTEVERKKLVAELGAPETKKQKRMTVGELKRHIAVFETMPGFTDDTPIAIAYECDNDIRWDLTMRFAYCKEFLLIEAKDVPSPEDLTIMAAASLTAYGDELSDAEAATLRNFSMAAF